MRALDRNEQRAGAAFRDLLARKKNPPWAVDEIVKRLRASGLPQTSMPPWGQRNVFIFTIVKTICYMSFFTQNTPVASTGAAVIGYWIVNDPKEAPADVSTVHCQ
jgi:hypothetical protein